MALKTTSKTGKLAEDFAVNFLSQKGYKILTRNFRSRFGEIDIIAKDGDTLVFVEVKARWNRNFGLPEESVTASKIQKIIKTSQYYSLSHPNLPKKQRIDVLAIEIEDGKVTDTRIIVVS